MRISNEIHLHELILLLLINNLKISPTSGKGNHFSDYEYPELQLLFNCKDETKEKSGNFKDGNEKNVQDKNDFSLSLDDKTNIESFQDSLKPYSGQDAKLKPWMRTWFAEEEKLNEEQSKYKEGQYDSEKWNPLREEMVKNSPYKGPPANDDVDKVPFHKEDKFAKSALSDEGVGLNSGHENYAKFDARIHRPLRKFKLHHKLKNMKQENIALFGDSNDRLKSHEQPLEEPEVPDIGMKYPLKGGMKSENKMINRGVTEFYRNVKNFENKMLPGKLKSHEYEGSFQEYEDHRRNKNEAALTNEHLPTVLLGGQIKQEAVSGTETIPLRKETFNESIDAIKQMKSISAVNQPAKSDPILQSVVTSRSRQIENILTTPVKMPDFVSSRNQIVEPKIQSLTNSVIATPPLFLPVPAVNNMAGYIGVKTNNCSSENKMTAQSLNNRGPLLKDNKQLLAKPPVKIANNLLEKPSDEESEGFRGDNVLPVHSVTNPSTEKSLINNDDHLGVDSGHQYKYQENREIIVIQKGENIESMPKAKRNVANESNGFHKSNQKEQKINLDSIESGNSIGLLDEQKQEMEFDDTSNNRNDKLKDPQYYSMSKGNIMNKVSSMFSNFKPNAVLRKKQISIQKGNTSVKRSAPPMYDQEYEAGYDYYSDKGNKGNAPLQSYYDYENEYDMDYEYPKLSRHNNTRLTGESEKEEYNEGKSPVKKVSKSRKKHKKQNSRKEDNYKDIFAHPLSLDDPELEVVRGNDAELVNRHSHQKNVGTRRHRTKPVDRNSEKYVKNRSGHEKKQEDEEDSSLSLKEHSRKQKVDSGALYHSEKMDSPEMSAIFGDEESTKKRSHLHAGREGG